MLTLDEAARRVGLAPNTLRVHIYRHATLKPARRTPRLMIDAAELERWNAQRLETIQQAQGAPVRRHPWYGKNRFVEGGASADH